MDTVTRQLQSLTHSTGLQFIVRPSITQRIRCAYRGHDMDLKLYKQMQTATESNDEEWTRKCEI